MPQLHKIECKWRFRVGTNSLTVTPSGAGASALHCDAGTAETFAALAAEVETKLKTVAAAFSVSVTSAGRVTIAHSGPTNFVIDWTDKSLAVALGFDGAQLTGAATYSSTAQSPLVFEASLPWSNDAPGLVFARKAPRLYRKAKRAIFLGKARVWSLDVRVSAGEVEQWRKTAGLLAIGMPARWFRNKDDAAAWAWDNFDGYVDVFLSADAGTLVDGWPAFPIRTDLVHGLDFTEWLNTGGGGGGGGGGSFGGG